MGDERLLAETAPGSFVLQISSLKSGKCLVGVAIQREV